MHISTLQDEELKTYYTDSVVSVYEICSLMKYLVVASQIDDNMTL